MAKSYMQDEKECYLCRKIYDVATVNPLHLHHIFEGWGNRRISEQHKEYFTIWLCPIHHNLSDYGIHFNKDIDLEVKKDAQRKFEETHTREEFMALIGKNYL